jgi:hypothetical protein
LSFFPHPTSHTNNPLFHLHSHPTSNPTYQQCLPVVKAASPVPSPSLLLDRPRPVFNVSCVCRCRDLQLTFQSRSVESTVSSRRATTPSESVPVPPSTSLPSLSVSLPFASRLLPLTSADPQTSLPRSSSSPVTLPVTTRSRVSYPVTSSSPSATTKSSTSSSARLSSPRVVSSPTFSLSSSPPRSVLPSCLLPLSFFALQLTSSDRQEGWCQGLPGGLIARLAVEGWFSGLFSSLVVAPFHSLHLWFNFAFALFVLL